MSIHEQLSSMFPTERLNPVAGTSNDETKVSIRFEFPTKRLNPVAGTEKEGNNDLVLELMKFPTKRLNPVAGTKMGKK